MKNVIIPAILISAILATAAVSAPSQSGSPAEEGGSSTAAAENRDADASTVHRQLAREAVKAGRPEVALRHLQLAHGPQPANLEVVDEFLNVASQRVTLMIESNDHQSAEGLIVWSRHIIDSTENALIEGEPSSLLALREREEVVEKLREKLQADVRKKAHRNIKIARQRAEDSSRWYWFNRRDDVRSGLKELHWVHQRYDWLDADVRGQFHLALSELKDRVSNKEWDDLLASAGFQARQRTAGNS